MWHLIGSYMRNMVGTIRDGTSRCRLSFDEKVSFSRCPFVPGQGHEQMSQDKLLCPVPSWDKITFPKEQKNRKRTFQNRKKAFQNRKKDVLKQEKDVQKQKKKVQKQERMLENRKRAFQNRKRCSKTVNSIELGMLATKT